MVAIAPSTKSPPGEVIPQRKNAPFWLGWRNVVSGFGTKLYISSRSAIQLTRGWAMPLSRPPRSRKLLHTRTVQCYGYQREDGLWDIEGHMTDVKTYSFTNKDRGGEIRAGEPLHAMSIRLTLD